MRVLYGACGDGMGHAMRSAVVARHLRARGHQVTFASSGKALEYLAREGRAVSIVGLEVETDGKKVLPLQTLITNVVKQAVGAFTALPAFLTVANQRPDVVISDFDPWSARVAHVLGAPLLAVDNIHFLSRCKHPNEVIASPFLGARDMALPVVDAMVLWASRYLVTSFVYAPPFDVQKTDLHLPILRSEVLARKGDFEEDHIVCYFNTHADHAEIARILRGYRAQQFHLYGKPGLVDDFVTENVTFCRFSDEAFLRDLATCRAVVGGAGFTLMSEAIYLGKPMLAVPCGDQFEQILNARYLKLLGYGSWCQGLSVEEIREFMRSAPAYRDRLQSFHHDGNQRLLSAVDDFLARRS